MHPAIHTTVFNSKPAEILATKLGSILSDILRLIDLESPRELAAAIAELSLRHIEYGMEDWHVEPFKAVMLAMLK